jgi:hypothetical protein
MHGQDGSKRAATLRGSGLDGLVPCDPTTHDIQASLTVRTGKWLVSALLKSNSPDAQVLDIAPCFESAGGLGVQMDPMTLGGLWTTQGE